MSDGQEKELVELSLEDMLMCDDASDIEESDFIVEETPAPESEEETTPAPLFEEEITPPAAPDKEDTLSFSKLEQFKSVTELDETDLVEPEQEAPEQEAPGVDLAQQLVDEVRQELLNALPGIIDEKIMPLIEEKIRQKIDS
ncbi:hypothetical protein [Solemya velum gill symbiont]|uniref:Uncharacterized protein n=1 Tax=Solemya velum gill symbiont TaxID=2340 RepID=A0A0B0H9U1_SOVGS|nr:hypothetical protein [Solemya velum gill symbiont]KHF25840.1 hypothetical protein JV46_13240 [Solemya velum gill symbiont]OOY34541.1 hypothetical protein BOV88_09560 [Solemya velum gill symbiont]OOY37256.1 hypothetical protein BOV89_08400 [Solemya velum gill symbiont]OOY40487.1 hypothetical protein BOV90_03695 [Solemya velum gill symbiont]OOY47575.1 hypothetical protein BOV93_06245 [Solemya velum gill symbiont]